MKGSRVNLIPFPPGTVTGTNYPLELLYVVFPEIVSGTPAPVGSVKTNGV